MTSFRWNAASGTLKDFGGRRARLTIHKTGMPFFDALRLYGAIDLYIGIREDVWIHDAGGMWEVNGRARDHRLQGRDIKAFKQIWRRENPTAAEYCEQIRASVESGDALPLEPMLSAKKEFDPSLQAGIRHIAAANYETLQAGQASPSTCCVAKIPVADALLAASGEERVQGRSQGREGRILFLPIFEGQIDLARVVSPLRVLIAVPNVTCGQAMALLALRTSLFAEGYQDRLTAVVFRTILGSRRSDNYSGVVAIKSTAIGRAKAADLVGHLYKVLLGLMRKAWTRQGVRLVPDALAMAYWLMQPLPKHLSRFITSQERLRRDRHIQVFVNPGYVKEVFEMSVGSWQGDYDAVRKFAKAVASGIYNSRMLPAKERGDDPQKAWYDEVTMLRSAPSAKAFIGRAMILIEQGHRAYSKVGTAHRGEDFDPAALFSSLGDNRSSFEKLRELFRMYLVQESTYPANQPEVQDISETEIAESLAGETEREDEE